MLKLTLTILIISSVLFADAQVKKIIATKPVTKTNTIKATTTVESKESLFKKLRSQILAFGDSVRNVSYSLEENTITIQYDGYDGKKVTQFVNNLDADAFTWEILNNALKFNMVSSDQDKYAQKRLLIDKAKFLEAQMRWLNFFPEDKNLPADSLNRRTFQTTMHGNPAALLDTNTLEIYFQNNKTSIEFNFSKISTEPNFQEKIAGLYRKLIVTCKKENSSSQ
ncbi:MAG: hypothetical protein JST62_12910 [Bacteroidetes bacterium]|nr:hypothetical protein [Bacteroidota bacterium]